MRKNRLAMALAMAFSPALPALADTPSGLQPEKSLGVVTITSGQPSSLPTQIPTTMEGVTREQLALTVNATDSEDALKYLPSLLVRKRYVGDYNHAVLSSRASGTGNSARSAVYADGILLSNFLGNGAFFAPRWGMVAPEEIERVDVMYGPFSAAYPGNSVGAVVDYVTRMPTKLEASAKLSHTVQPFELYGTRRSFHATQASASLGSRSGDWSWWINASHTDSLGHPQTFVTRRVQDGVAGGAGTPVSGAVRATNNAGEPIHVLGTGTQYHTRQDHLKIKLAYDLTPTVRASYTLGHWRNDSKNRPQSYLTNAAGEPVYSGGIRIDGLQYTAGPQALGATAFGVSNEMLEHWMHGLSLKSHTQDTWDWEVAASLFDYARDQQRIAGTAYPGALGGGAGSLVDQRGTGWNALSLKGTWRPQGKGGEHIVDMGYQQTAYRLRHRRSAVAGNWQTDPAGLLQTAVRGSTQLHGLYVQDAWSFAPQWKAVLGLRWEQWRASDGFTQFAPGNSLQHPARQVSAASPKLALSYQWAPDLVLKASAGRAVRFPTVNELYGATSSVNSQYINDPNLRPEKSWTTELSAEKDLGDGLLRLTWFTEGTRDALYSQTTYDSAAAMNISRVQNVDRIRTQGLEMAYNGFDLGLKGLDVSASLTYTDSVIRANRGFVTVPGDTVGKWQPNIPRWRATALVSYRFAPDWTGTVAARYSGRQYRTLNNADINGQSYMGLSPYFTVDLRVHWRINRQLAAAFGIDNLNNYRYWNFHPYPQRSYSTELNFTL